MVTPVSRIVLFGVIAVGAHQVTSAQNHNIVYVEDYATCDVPANKCGTFGNSWHGLDSLDHEGGIKSALAACGVNAGGDSHVGCTVILPRGYVAISETIDLTNLPLR